MLVIIIITIMMMFWNDGIKKLSKSLSIKIQIDPS